jgi:geranylgeranyl diphosphate synthase type II
LQEKHVKTEAAFCLEAYLKTKKQVIDDALKQYLPGQENYPPVIFQAMRYSLLAGGKRIRPVLCLAALDALGAEHLQGAVLPVACALEMIHTYSLIHDDLPAMDDDDLRRGIPTSHKVFGEDIAILAGDALLTEAFGLLSNRELTAGIPPERILAVIHEIATAAGCFGMIGGQVVDVRSEGMAVDEDALYYIHTHKTGAMIVASIRAGALLAGAGQDELAALSRYGHHIGLMFQIADDILNVEGDRFATGKSTGSDATRGKVTFPSLFGLDKSREKACGLAEQALQALSGFDGRTEPLRMLVRNIIERKT